MGNQPSQPGDPDTVTHHTFYAAQQKRYMGLRWDGVVHAKAWGPGAFARYMMRPFGGDSLELIRPSVGEERRESVRLVSLQVVGTGDDMPGRFLALSENGNLIGSDAAWPWELIQTNTGSGSGAETAENISLRVPDHGVLPSPCTAARGQYLKVCIDDASIRVGSNFDDECVFAMSLDTIPVKKLENMRSGAAFFASKLPHADVPDYPAPTLSPSDIEAYKRDGFIVCRGLLSPEVIEAAKAKIGEGLEKGVDRSKGFLGLGKGRQTWPNEYAKSEEVLNIMRQSPAMRNCETLTDAALVAPPSGQIALRFKTEDGTKDFGAKQLDWHIDAYEKFSAARFAVLVVVALSDWTEDNCGNFCVYPGTHHKVAKMMQEMSWREWNKAVLNSVPLGVEPHQVKARTGDVILAHPLLAHDVAPNLTDNPRWAVIFRPRFASGSRRDELLNPEQPSSTT